MQVTTRHAHPKGLIMNTRSTLSATIAGSALAAAILSGCQQVHHGTPTSAPPPAPAAVTAPITPAAGSPNLNGKFGQTSTYQDGITVTVSAPRRFTPSQYAYVDQAAAAYVEIKVTIGNKGALDFDPSMVSVSAASGGAEAGTVTDSPAVGVPPTTTVLPARSVTWVEGFAVRNPADVTVEVDPGITATGDSYDPSIFTEN